MDNEKQVASAEVAESSENVIIKKPQQVGLSEQLPASEPEVTGSLID